jgi:plastocyanin
MILAASWSFAGTPPTILSDAWVDVNVAQVVASDVDGDILTYTWSKVSGPGSVSFTPNGTTDSDATSVSFSEGGTYVLQVSVSDGSLSTTSTVTATIPTIAFAVGQPQVEITGPTTVIFNAGDSINFTCTAYSLDTVTSTQIPLTGNEIRWTSSLNGTLAQTGSSIFVTSLTPGVHTITCTGTNAGGVGSDTITITINGSSTEYVAPRRGEGCSFSSSTGATSVLPIMLAILAGLAIWQRRSYQSLTR